ncbi:MAG TPA: alpha/beta hydrolase [Roseiarcus sp.]
MSANCFPDVEIIQDIQYTPKQATPLNGVLYRPRGAASSPVVVAVHGGAWKQGSPQRYSHWGRYLAQHGIALYAISYRLADRAENRFPAALLDVLDALQFVKGAAGELNLDGGRIALLGDSAGAHLASLAVLATRSGQSWGDFGWKGADCQVRAVVAVYGVYDLLAQWEHDLVARPRDPITENLLGVSPLEDRFAYFKASPISYVSTQGAKVPFLVSWGTEDDVVDYSSQSAKFVTALKQVGGLVRTVAVLGAPHFWIEQPLEDHGSFAGFLAPTMLRFLQQHFGM